MHSPKITLITPTCDRPFGISLMEKYIKAQTMKHHQWIVVDGGQVPAKLNLDQTHILKPFPAGNVNFCRNILHALPYVEGDIVIFIEDDDVYLPNHIEILVESLKTQPAAGGAWLNYYHLGQQLYITYKVSGTSLSQTGMHADLIPYIKDAAERAMVEGTFCVDNYFWSRVGVKYANGPTTSYGIKGLKGTKGLGSGHTPSSQRAWKKDKDFVQLRKWLGDLSKPYEKSILKANLE